MRVLLYGSLFFYAYNEPLLTPILIIITFISYASGYLIAKYKLHKRKILLIFLLSLLGIYFPLKYNESFIFLFKNIFHFEGLRWLYLPLGLSFYAFKTISYVVDIYYQKIKPQKSFEKYLLYVSFFPQIFCGPIMNADEFFKQLDLDFDFKSEVSLEGLNLIVIGLFKKLVLANNLFLLIQNAYLQPNIASGFEWVLISVLTRFYIYYDFSGYSDISNGVSLLFGITVRKNFDLPFKSKSITEFWRRWHISLSNWIRDYVYYPLVSKFSSYTGIYLSLIISFVCLGLWHGDKINFIIYGLINGLAISASTYFARKNRGAPDSSTTYKIVSRTLLYLFVIFIPSVLLLVHDNDTFFKIIHSFVFFPTWLKTTYFSNLDVNYIVYLILPIAFCFELLTSLYIEKIKKYFNELTILKRFALLATGVLLIFSLLSPAINYRFLYQGF